jgi:5-methylcytosine-specific restriction endonuclease McrA
MEKRQHNRWYDLHRWTKRSQQQLHDHPLCAICLKRGRVTPAEVADHVIPHKNNYEMFWWGDLQSLCSSCHSSTKRQEEIHGYSREIGMNGWPVDPDHPANKV